jgi:hypothetical protein
MKFKLIFIMLVLFNSCKQEETKSTTPDVKSEIEKWKKELLLNGEIGTPCDFSKQEEWSKKNPEVFYGLPDSIMSGVFDINKDHVNDILLFFPAGDCCSCSMGMNQRSDFVKLIYSNGNDYLTNDNLETKIENKVENKFYEQTHTDVQRVIFSITNFNKEITGTFKLWTSEDPDCCNGVEGTYKYNPFTFQMQITYKKAQ